MFPSRQNKFGLAELCLRLLSAPPPHRPSVRRLLSNKSLDGCEASPSVRVKTRQQISETSNGADQFLCLVEFAV